MSDAETYGQAGAELLSYPRDTIQEALREYAGDGEGLGEEILDRYDAKVRAEEREKCAALIQPAFTIDYITARDGGLVQDPAMSANQALHRAATRIREQGKEQGS